MIMFIIIIIMYVDTFFVILTTIHIFHCTHTSPPALPVQQSRRLNFRKQFPCTPYPPVTPAPSLIPLTLRRESCMLTCSWTRGRGRKRRQIRNRCGSSSSVLYIVCCTLHCALYMVCCILCSVRTSVRYVL